MSQPIKKTIVIIPILLLILTTLPLTTSQQITNQNEQNSSPNSTVEILVYTATQAWPSLSWIYLLTLDGTPITSYEYEWYLFCDLEVVQNELYITDWIAPCLYHVNLTNGELTQIITDFSLLYMYDVAYDGTYFYLDEWGLSRYDINGNKDSTISFPEDIRGSTFDTSYYWTLLTSGQIKCWNTQNWPTITELPTHTFSPPTSFCRGLWFDGTYFWTAESIEGSTCDPLPPNNITIYGTGDQFTLILAVYNHTQFYQSLQPNGKPTKDHALNTFYYTETIQAAGDTYRYLITITNEHNITATQI